MATIYSELGCLNRLPRLKGIRRFTNCKELTITDEVYLNVDELPVNQKRLIEVIIVLALLLLLKQVHLEFNSVQNEYFLLFFRAGKKAISIAHIHV